MYIKELVISSKKGILREIKFHKGLNLIVDETPNLNKKETGNSVGKTTILKLVDFCLGANSKNIYTDEETKKNEYKEVKDFLISYEILITLLLIENLDDEKSEQIKIERNFLSSGNGDIIRNINGEKFSEKDFELELLRLFFPNQISDKPTFRQIISHNVRYKDYSINNTLKTLDPYTKDSEYESLYLYLFNCNFNKGSKRQDIIMKLKKEKEFKQKLESKNTKNAYEASLGIIVKDIEKLNQEKKNIHTNPNFEQDIKNFNNIKYDISKLSNYLSRLNIRKNLILESKQELEGQKSNIDFEQLRTIYEQTKLYIKNIQKTFEDLCIYHDKMLNEKIKFIVEELPSLENKIKNKEQELQEFLNKEKILFKKLESTNSFEKLEKIIFELNIKYQKKGECEGIIEQINEVEETILDYESKLKNIDDDLFSGKYEELIKKQLANFNLFFSEVSEELYGEQYAIKYEITEDRYKHKYYKFTTFNTNMSSGKKQGEISSFDVAYVLFARSENIPHLNFLLNDKKELMHDNQLINISRICNENNIQFVASILKDKLPTELNNENNFIVKLSQNKKLFNIENIIQEDKKE